MLLSFRLFTGGVSGSVVGMMFRNSAETHLAARWAFIVSWHRKVRHVRRYRGRREDSSVAKVGFFELFMQQLERVVAGLHWKVYTIGAEAPQRVDGRPWTTNVLRRTQVLSEDAATQRVVSALAHKKPLPPTES